MTDNCTHEQDPTNFEQGCSAPGATVAMALAPPGPTPTPVCIPPPAICDLPFTRPNELNVVRIFNTTLQLYKRHQIMVAFDGGKECTVVLHMLLRYLRRNGILRNLTLPVLYVRTADAFNEVDQFVDCTANVYPIELIKREGTIKEVLEALCAERPNIKAIFMGCRRENTPCAEALVMQGTDPGWPKFLRVNPIIEWTCQDVWNYLRCHKVPYCTLYDDGYSSVGDTKNTIRNPHLRIISPKTCKIVGYRHAYELKSCALDRVGRLTGKEKEMEEVWHPPRSSDPRLWGGK